MATEELRDPESVLHRQIGERIKLTRLAIWGQDRGRFLAEMGVSTNQICRWEKGQSPPLLTFLARLYHEHDVSADWIINGKLHRLPAELVAKIQRQASPVERSGSR